MILVDEYDDLAAMAVLRNIDPQDRLEAQAVRGEVVTHLSLFGDWRAARPLHVLSLVIRDARSHEAIALLALANTGQAGVASAALVARNHRRYRRQLAALARVIRKDMPEFARKAGIFRVEARAWASHPRASKFLHLVGFTHECVMPGFGRGGREQFVQFAWSSAQADVDRDAWTQEGQRHVHVQDAEGLGRAAEDRGL